MTYKTQIPDIANRVKYCVTPEALVEFVKSELENAYQLGYQAGMVEGRLIQMDKQIEDVEARIEDHVNKIDSITWDTDTSSAGHKINDHPPIAGEKRLHPIFDNILAATRMGRI